MASDKTRRYEEEYERLKTAAPTYDSGKSEYGSLADAALEKLRNRGKFMYDVNSDALYDQYKNKYVSAGNKAMADTVAKASALTGGYNNTYAQSAGQQAYNEYMTKLNDKIPELEALAYQRWQAENSDLKNQYALYADREAQDYSRYRDSLNDYYDRLGIARSDYAASAEADAEADSRRIAQEQWQAEHDYAKAKDEADNAYKYAALAEQRRQADLDSGYKYAALEEDRRQADLDNTYKMASLVSKGSSASSSKSSSSSSGAGKDTDNLYKSIDLSKTDYLSVGDLKNDLVRVYTKSGSAALADMLDNLFYVGAINSSVMDELIDDVTSYDIER